jgi:hypothetical protein
MIQGMQCQCELLTKTISEIRTISCKIPFSLYNLSEVSLELRNVTDVLDSKLIPVSTYTTQLLSIRVEAGKNQCSKIDQISLSNHQRKPTEISAFSCKFEPVIFFVTFEIKNPNESILNMSILKLHMMPSVSTFCDRSQDSLDCNTFKEQRFRVINLTITANFPEILFLRGTFSVSNCPAFLCGSSGRGIFFDAEMFMYENRVAHRKHALHIIPDRAKSALSVLPQVIPSSRSFVFTVIVPSVSEFTTVGVNLLDSRNYLKAADIEKISVNLDGHVEFRVQSPALNAGYISGIIFSGEPSSRQSTIATFELNSVYDPAVPAVVDWVSKRAGPAFGTTTVQVRLLGFPMMDSVDQVIDFDFIKQFSFSRKKVICVMNLFVLSNV